MKHAKESSAPRWLVPYLGRKVRQLRKQNKALRNVLDNFRRMLWNCEQNRAQTVKNYEGALKSLRDYNTRLTNDIITAYEKIGGLHYILESNGIEIPENLK